MNRNQALGDLKTIRQIMKRTQKEAGRHSGWFILIAGVLWLVGFTANQFVPEYAGWTWAAVNLGGMIAMGWTGIRLTRRSDVRTTWWKPIFFFWVILAAFAILLGWLFDANDSVQIGLLAILAAALGYVQIGAIFQSLHISITGILVAAMAIGAFFLIPDHFLLAMALLGGGLLIGSGLWMIRSRT
ncbi:MAG: hypothetical protein AB8I69_19405 [Anaerolineae bacterium]